MSRHCLPLHPSKSLALHLVCEIRTTKDHPLCKEGEVMENDHNDPRMTGEVTENEREVTENNREVTENDHDDPNH